MNKEEVWAALKEHLSRELQPHEIERRELSKRLFPYVHRFYEDWPLGGGAPHYAYNRAVDAESRTLSTSISSECA